MKEPQRYSLFAYSDGAEMVEDDDGEYVDHADYATLRARFDALVGEVLKQRSDLLAGWTPTWPGLLSWCDAAIENAEKE